MVWLAQLIKKKTEKFSKILLRDKSGQNQN